MKHNSCSDFAVVVIVAVGILKALWPSSSVAQQSPAQGVIRFVNASTVAGRVLVTIDGTKLRPDGFGPGENTGGIGIRAGAHRFDVTNANAKPGEANIRVEPNASITLIAFNKSVHDPQTGKSVDTLQLFPNINPQYQPGKHFQIIYASSKPVVEVTVNGQPIKLASLHVIKVEGGAIKVEYARTTVVAFSANEAGNFLVVVFDKPDGSVGGVVLPDYR